MGECSGFVNIISVFPRRYYKIGVKKIFGKPEHIKVLR